MNCIRKIVVIIYFFTITCNGWGQNLIVKSFNKCVEDISARTEKRLDANGNICALIKVSVVPDCEFGGYVIGNVEKKLGMYWVYVCAINPTTRNLIISSEGHLPLTVNFKDYGIETIEGGSTYALVIESPSPISIDKELNGHKYVDLGLSVYWADCNVGAVFPEEYGEFYGWGGPTGNFKSEYDDGYQGESTPSNICASEYDIARAKWGGSWRLPTRDEMEELIHNCLMHSDTIEGIKGVRLTGPSGESIFIPFAGYKDSKTSSWENQRTQAYLWTGECDSRKNRPYALRIGSHQIRGGMGMPFHLFPGWFCDLSTWISFSSQFSIRPVVKNRNSHKNYYKQTLKNGKVKIKCQIENFFFNDNSIGRVTIRDANTNEVFYEISKEDTDEGIFEMHVRDGVTLRFEAEGYEPTEVELSDIVKIMLNIIPPKFGLG